MRSSRLGGVPTTVPAPGTRTPGQLGLDLAEIDVPRVPKVTRPLPDVVHIQGWRTPTEQQDLVAQFREWAVPPAGLRHPRVPTGHLMTVQSVCLGWHWQPYAYSRTADDTDHAPVKPMTAELVTLARRGRSTNRSTPMPRSSIYYAPGAHLGLHQDGEEPSSAPVVTISLGDTCVFRFAGTDRRTGPFTDVQFHSGDLLVFGGRNRRTFHGVPKVVDGTAPRAGSVSRPAG